MDIRLVDKVNGIVRCNVEKGNYDVDTILKEIKSNPEFSNISEEELRNETDRQISICKRYYRTRRNIEGWR